MPKITIDRSGLQRGMAQIARIVERRSTIPVLQNVRLETIGRSLTLTATDLDIEIRTVLDCDATDDGRITVPAHLLHDLTRKVSDGPLDLSWDEKATTMLLKAGRSRFTLQTIPADDFPDLMKNQPSHGLRLEASLLADMISHVDFAISTEKTRYYLNGIYFHINNQAAPPSLATVATDGHRLALYETVAPQGSEGMPGVIIPRKTVSEMARLTKDFSGTLDVALSSAKITVTAGQTTLTSKLIDGTFPDYTRVIPRDNGLVATLRREELQSAVDRVGTLSSANGRAMKFSFSADALKLSVVNPDAGASDEDIECAFDGADIETGFNSRYVMDMLAVLPGESITFAIKDAGSPALVRATDRPEMLAVIMPMRV